MQLNSRIKKGNRDFAAGFKVHLLITPYDL